MCIAYIHTYIQASRLYFAEHNVEGMLEVLRPMHELMQKGPETLREITFQQQLGRDLQEAQDWCERYKQSRQEKDLQQVYFTTYVILHIQLPCIWKAQE
jgi:FKBP12-rapamycin complex-associated protein